MNRASLVGLAVALIAASSQGQESPPLGTKMDERAIQLRYEDIIGRIRSWPDSTLKSVMEAEASCMRRLHPEFLEWGLEKSCLAIEPREVASFRAIKGWDPLKPAPVQTASPS